MDVQDSFRVLNDSQCIERKCFTSSVVWEIANPWHYIQNTAGIYSPTFQCSKYSWKLSLRRSGDRYAYEDEVFNKANVYLNYIGSNSSNICIRYFKLNLADSANRTLFENARENRSISLQEKKITIPVTLNVNFPNVNPLIISFDLYVEEKFQPETLKELKGKLKRPELSDFEATCSDLEVFCKNRRLSDVTLKVADSEFKAHKVVLCARSKVFAAMFEHDTQENRTDTVDIVEMEAKTVEDMLRYIYCGKAGELSPEEALNLFVAADRYDLQELKNFCREEVLNGLSTGNVCDVAAVADLHDDEILIKKFKSFLSENGKDVIKTEKWKAVCAQNPSLGSKMFEWIFSE